MYDYYDNECDYCERVELEDYLYEIKDIIEKQVEDKVKNKTKELSNFEKKKDYYINENINLKKELSKLSSELRDKEYEISRMKNNHEYELEKQRKELSKNSVEYMLGDWKDCDTVYWIRESTKNMKCPHCNGSGEEEIEANGKKYNVKCSYCNGERSFRIKEKFVDYRYFGSRGLMVDKYGEICFVYDGYVRKLSEEKYYKTRSEIDEVVKKQNKDIERRFNKKYQEWKNENNIK